MLDWFLWKDARELKGKESTMETEATKELRAIKDAISSQYKTFREFFAALLERQRQRHPELATA